MIILGVLISGIIVARGSVGCLWTPCGPLITHNVMHGDPDPDPGNPDSPSIFT